MVLGRLPDRGLIYTATHILFGLKITILQLSKFCFFFLFFSTDFYSPYRTLAFLNGLLDPQSFGRTPWLGDQSKARFFFLLRT